MKGFEVDCLGPLNYFRAMKTPNRLSLTFVNELLHIALTSRVKGTNRPFTHLVHTLTGEWKLVRHNSNGADPTVVESHTGINIPDGSKVVNLKEFPCLGDYALVFPLEDYRPCKLTARVIAGREMPYVIGGGNVYSFIENIIDQIYQYHIDCDRNRNEDDLTFAYDLEGDSAYNPIHTAPAEAVVEGDPSGEVTEPDVDPFNELYRRDGAMRQVQWQAAIKLEPPVEPKQVEREKPVENNMAMPRFSLSMEELRAKDPIRHDLLNEKLILHNVFPEGIQDLGDDEKLNIHIFITMLRALNSKYKYVRRNIGGSWVAYNVETDWMVFYYNPSSKLCGDSIIDEMSIGFFITELKTLE